MQRRSLSWIALLGAVLAGVVAMSAASPLAARSTASPFKLVFQGRQELVVGPGDVILDARLVGTFTSGAPFCDSGTAGDPSWAGDTVRRYTCTDGSGGLTLGITNPMTAVHGGSGYWSIVEGFGRYAGLRGKGSYSEELLDGDSEDLEVPFRTTIQGLLEADAVAPSLTFMSTTATKLRHPAGAYSISVAVSLRDDVEGNTVAYRLAVTQTRAHRLIELASTEGTTASGSVSTTLRIVPGKRVPNVRLWLRGSDPLGNEVSITRSLKLPP